MRAAVKWVSLAFVQEVDDVCFAISRSFFATCLGSVFGVPRLGLAAPGDPCSLLTPAQVSAALGVNVSPGQTTGGRICRWAEPGARAGRGSPALVLTMQVAKAFDFAKSPSKSANLVKTPAVGVGDDAVFNTFGVVGATLTVKKGRLSRCGHPHVVPVLLCDAGQN